jgi:CrcB protein
MSLPIYAWVMIGSALGGGARYWCSGLIADFVGQTFPWGTIVVNVVGSFIIGFFNAVTGPDGRFLVSPEARQFVMVGVCGGYTTFSSFSLQTLSLMRNGEWMPASANAVLSFALCMLAVWLGHLAAAGMNQLKGV